jgi:hypothetical protein
MSEIAESLFSHGYDLSSGNGFIGLEFTPPSEKQAMTTLAGRGLAIARYIASIDNLEIALPIDITALDRFCSATCRSSQEKSSDARFRSRSIPILTRAVRRRRSQPGPRDVCAPRGEPCASARLRANCVEAVGCF